MVASRLPAEAAAAFFFFGAGFLMPRAMSANSRNREPLLGLIFPLLS